VYKVDPALYFFLDVLTARVYLSLRDHLLTVNINTCDWIVLKRTTIEWKLESNQTEMKTSNWHIHSLSLSFSTLYTFLTIVNTCNFFLVFPEHLLTMSRLNTFVTQSQLWKWKNWVKVIVWLKWNQTSTTWNLHNVVYIQSSQIWIEVYERKRKVSTLV
jgi:hypothetical protein